MWAFLSPAFCPPGVKPDLKCDEEELGPQHHIPMAHDGISLIRCSSILVSPKSCLQLTRSPEKPHQLVSYVIVSIETCRVSEPIYSNYLEFHYYVNNSATLT